MAYATSVAFQEAVRSSHRLAIACDVIYDGVVIYADVPIVAGSVTEDRTRFVRRDGTISVDPALAPTLLAWTDTLIPGGAEIRPKRGVYLGATAETVPLGTLLIVDVDVERNGLVRVRCQDRAARIAEDELEGSFTTDVGGMGTQETVEALVARTYPDLTVTWQGGLGNPVIPAGTQFTGTAAAAIGTLVAGIGAEFRFDADGEPEVVALPTLATAVSVVEWDEGPTGVVVTRSDSLSRQGAYNAVRVTGESVGDSATPSGFASLGSGPMAYGGPFGRVVKKVSAPNLLSDAACQALADDLVGDGEGLPHKIDLAVVPNPSIHAGDGATISRPGLSIIHLLERVTVDLSAKGAMTASTIATPWSPA